MDFYPASIIFFKLQVSLNMMWDIVPKMENVSQNVIVVVRSRLLAAAAALSGGVYLLAVLILSNLWAALPTEVVIEWFPGLENWVALLSFVISPVMYMIPFAIIYKLLPQAKVLAVAFSDREGGGPGKDEDVVNLGQVYQSLG